MSVIRDVTRISKRSHGPSRTLGSAKEQRKQWSRYVTTRLGVAHVAGKLAVIGAGLMGSGIAQVAAQAGWDVVLRDVTDAALTRGTDGIKASYDRFVSKGKLDAGAAGQALGRITTTTDLDAVADADIVVEAVFEKLEVKHEIFRALDGLVKDEAVLASNTSAIPITKIAAATARPERVVGVHFFSPVPM